ncbi:oxidoreductase [Heyndrickxia shackletonii]|uniref:Oxidoreductase n=2 Tax=Heyndrickxia shackletonii TaxID=157838 RepID=A0A0Q3TJW2_9BACI|nr:oxidoreductase [Heyndrickxia shackletonii]NEZ01243.1 Gfo/Idh/MocA family oxidoreductase [Heyndrickxia shackletonii]
MDDMLANGKVGFAIIGCGIIANIHAKGIQETEEAELMAVYDVKKDVAVDFAIKYGAKVYESIEEMLEVDEIDVICICTPSGIHAEETIQAAKAKKHILVEKPMAIKLEDVDRMIQTCQENEVKLGTIFPRRMSPQAKYAKQLIQEGKLGKLSLCSAYVKLYRNQEYYDSAGWRGTWEMDGGGAMMNQGIHTVDMLQWLVGPVSSIFGKAKAILRDIEVEDTVVSTLEFKSGALGILEITTTAVEGKGQRFEIHGEKGTLEIEEDTITRLVIEGEKIELPSFEPFKVIPDGHRIQIRDMALAIIKNREPIVTGVDGKHSLQMILGTYESSRSQKEIFL